MTLAIDLPSYCDSPLGRWDARWKLAAFGMALVSVCALTQLIPATIALGGVFLLAALGRLPLRWFLGRLGGAMILLLPFLVVLPFIVHKGGPAWSLAGLRVSLDGVHLAAFLAVKAAALVSLALVLLGTTELPRLLHAGHALKIPGLFIQLVVLSYRYIFLLANELARLRIALRSRGYRNRMSRHSYRTIGHVTGTLFVRSHERAERVGQAMRCRGFAGRFHSMAEFRTEASDIIFFLLVSCVAATLVLADFFGC